MLLRKNAVSGSISRRLQIEYWELSFREFQNMKLSGDGVLFSYTLTPTRLGTGWDDIRANSVEISVDYIIELLESFSKTKPNFSS
jgi:hypothetical protein